MPSNLILDLFYNDIIIEAQVGRIDAFFMMNLIFEVSINNKQITNTSVGYEDVIIPTLKINNKELFDKLLVEYVNLSINTYDQKNFSFLNDVIYTEGEEDPKTLRPKYLIKYIICTLLANASYIDFEDPIKFLQNRIDMLEQNILPTQDTINLGYFDSIGASIYIKEEISPIKAETPRRITGYVEYDDGYQLILPEIYMGKTDDKYLIYGIQKTTSKSNIDEKPYIKQIRKGLNSRLYAIPEHYFLAYIISLVLCNDKPIEIIPFLIERWNAKSIALSRDTKHTEEEKEQYKESMQNKITNDFLRVYLKLMEVTPEINIISYPFEIDDHFHISMLEQPNSKASVMNEFYSRYTNYTKDNQTLIKK